MIDKLGAIPKFKIFNRCPICSQTVEDAIGKHINAVHSREEIKHSILEMKEKGISDPEIGEIFGITFKELEKIIIESYGINVSILKKKRIKYWAPKEFKEETTSVWSFKQRGDWATHDGRYRGNWSPYIPRNIILKYSNPGDTVLDFFVGGGTTAVEAKLLGRRCIARDINPQAIELTKKNLNFDVPRYLFREYEIFEPKVQVGDARDLSDIDSESIDLICAHPPYAGIVKYSSKIEGDLSNLGVEEFVKEMEKVARESYRVLKPGGKCAILIGDTRVKKRIIPIGFKIINVFLEVGFKLRELVIKRQHNCKSSGFWYNNSIKYNFLLLAHEYLPIFEKCQNVEPLRVSGKDNGYPFLFSTLRESVVIKNNMDSLETSTVWVFPEDEFEELLNKNIVDRYSDRDSYSTISIVSNLEEKVENLNAKNIKLLLIKSPVLKELVFHYQVDDYLYKIKKTVESNLPYLSSYSFLAIQTQDVRINGYIEPLAKKITDMFENVSDRICLKEIIIVTSNRKDLKDLKINKNLEITHQYILVYEVNRC